MAKGIANHLALDWMAEPAAAHAGHKGGGGRGKPKLSEEDVRAIRMVARAGGRMDKLLDHVCAKWDITRNYARQVMAGDTHPHVL